MKRLFKKERKTSCSVLSYQCFLNPLHLPSLPGVWCDAPWSWSCSEAEQESESWEVPTYWVGTCMTQFRKNFLKINKGWKKVELLTLMWPESSVRQNFSPLENVDNCYFILIMTELMTSKANLCCPWLSQNPLASREWYKLIWEWSSCKFRAESQLGLSYCYQLLWKYIYGTWVSLLF